KATGKEQSMTITGQSSLDSDVIDQMVSDAEAHAEEDRQRREEAEIRNAADTLVYQTERLLQEQAEAVSDDEKETINSKLADLRSALEGDDIEAVKSATEALMTASQEFGQRLYDAAAAAEREPGAPGDASDDDDVVEAEIVDDDRETA
ncbi:MAG: Hsp70 family protein, partial [Acidimicrobiaceae bacterium]|nr:Hsp70 family protein [Acidimicrobiaceae bacterium]